MLTMSLYSGDGQGGLTGTQGKKMGLDRPIGVEGIVNTTLRRLEPREHVCREGETKHYVYQVEHGAVCLYRSMPDGHRQIMDFAYPGDFVGLGTSERHMLSGQAIGHARLRCIPVSAIRQLAARDPEFCFRLYEALSAELSAARDLLATVGTRSATERLASFLVALARRNERGGLYGQQDRLADVALGHRRFLEPYRRNGEPDVHTAQAARHHRLAAKCPCHHQ